MIFAIYQLVWHARMELRQIREDRAKIARQVFCLESGKGTLGAGQYVFQIYLPLQFELTEAHSVLEASSILILQGDIRENDLNQNSKAQN